MSKLRIRIDDVMVNSNTYKDPETRFEQITRWLEKSDKILHVPTILVKDIQNYPGTIELIKEKIKNKTMAPELHGWEHVDYNKLEEHDIAKHLFKSIQWFENTLEIRPKVWATPWGAESEKLTKVSFAFGLSVEGTKHCWDPAGWLTQARRTKSLPIGVTVMDHWWTRGLRLQRIALCLEYGSFEKAKKERPDVFGN